MIKRRGLKGIGFLLCVFVLIYFGDRVVNYSRNIPTYLTQISNNSILVHKIKEIVDQQKNFVDQDIGNYSTLIIPEEYVIYEDPMSEATYQNGINSTCPKVPPNLRGRISILKSPIPRQEAIEQKLDWLKLGGHYQPEFCIAPHKLAVIVPYRNRKNNLLIFLQHIHPFLKRQLLDYTIFIVEQYGNDSFNRAKLMNVGFQEASLGEFDYFIFHDVDLLPEDDRNLYSYPKWPRHMSVAVDILHYKLLYKELIGGVTAMSKFHFQLVNGFSNSFWGWGGEDDDLFNRLRHQRFFIMRYPNEIARYTALTHGKQLRNPKRFETLKLGKFQYDKDGLNNLEYSVKEFGKNLLYTWLLVGI